MHSDAFLFTPSFTKHLKCFLDNTPAFSKIKSLLLKHLAFIQAYDHHFYKPCRISFCLSYLYILTTKKKTCPWMLKNMVQCHCRGNQQTAQYIFMKYVKRGDQLLLFMGRRLTILFHIFIPKIFLDIINYFLYQEIKTRFLDIRKLCWFFIMAEEGPSTRLVLLSRWIVRKHK